MVVKTLDYTGLRCPMPVLKTKKELKTINSGETIEVIADDIGAKKDIPAMLKKTGNELVELREDNGNLVFVIKKA
ncbi:MAG: sulfurtransferase TusA family protein [Promethearchaeota archaeon]